MVYGIWRPHRGVSPFHSLHGDTVFSPDRQQSVTVCNCQTVTVLVSSGSTDFMTCLRHVSNQKHNYSVVLHIR